MSHYVALSQPANGTLIDISGDVLPGRQVNIYLRNTTTTVTVYPNSDGTGTPLTQPLTTDSNGQVPGYCISGQSIDYYDSATGLRKPGELISALDVLSPSTGNAKLLMGDAAGGFSWGSATQSGSQGNALNTFFDIQTAFSTNAAADYKSRISSERFGGVGGRYNSPWRLGYNLDRGVGGGLANHQTFHMGILPDCADINGLEFEFTYVDPANNTCFPMQFTGFFDGSVTGNTVFQLPQRGGNFIFDAGYNGATNPGIFSCSGNFTADGHVSGSPIFIVGGTDVAGTPYGILRPYGPIDARNSVSLIGQAGVVGSSVLNVDSTNPGGSAQFALNSPTGSSSLFIWKSNGTEHWRAFHGFDSNYYIEDMVNTNQLFVLRPGTSTTASLTLNGSLVVGTGALATTATGGFFYAPSCAGAPTGVPAAKTGTVPIVYDTTNSKLWAYIGGAWKGVVLA